MRPIVDRVFRAFRAAAFLSDSTVAMTMWLPLSTQAIYQRSSGNRKQRQIAPVYLREHPLPLLPNKLKHRGVIPAGFQTVNKVRNK